MCRRCMINDCYKFISKYLKILIVSTYVISKCLNSPNYFSFLSLLISIVFIIAHCISSDFAWNYGIILILDVNITEIIVKLV